MKWNFSLNQKAIPKFSLQLHSFLGIHTLAMLVKKGKHKSTEYEVFLCQTKVKIEIRDKKVQFVNVVKACVMVAMVDAISQKIASE